MSDVSKNEALIEYARSSDLRNDPMVIDLLDALEAASVPVQGEPNGDRELIEKIAGTIAVNELLREGTTWADLLEKDRESYRITARNVIGLASRAVVPDAATERIAELEAERDDLEERLSKYLWDSTGGMLSKTGYDVRTMVAHTEEHYDKLHAEAREVLEAERDTATAAIERVRAIHLPVALETKTVCGSGCSDDWPCETIAALDGVPEPESITIPRPVVPFGPVSKTENEATADYLLEVVKKIDGKYCTVGGSNVTATVRKLLVDTAEALRGLPVGGGSKP